MASVPAVTLGGWPGRGKDGLEGAQRGVPVPLETLAPGPILVFVVRKRIVVTDDGRPVCHHA